MDKIRGDTFLKTKRVPNFTHTEKENFLKTLNKFRHIVDCKKTDLNAKRDKEEAWRAITKIFNSQNPCTVYRSAKCLRKFYDNWKRAQRLSEIKKKFRCKLESNDEINEEDESRELILEEFEVVDVNAKNKLENNDGVNEEYENGESLLEEFEVVNVNRTVLGKKSNKRQDQNRGKESQENFTLLDEDGNPARWNTSSPAADILSTKQAQLIDLQIKKLNLEMDVMNHKQENDDAEHKMRMELMRLEIQLKMKQLNNRATYC